jgi:hypothetical protein
MIFVMRTDIRHTWILRLKLLAVVIVVVLAILVFSFDNAYGAETCVDPRSGCVDNVRQTHAASTVPPAATCILIGALSLAALVNRRTA